MRDSTRAGAAGAPVEGMTPYDARAWAEIETWRADRLASRTRLRIPVQVRDAAAGAGRRARKAAEQIPGFSDFEIVFRRSLGGLLDLGARGATATLRESSIVTAYQAQGHHVTELDDIRRLELRDIDRVRPKLTLRYTTAMAAEGAVAGLAISGGEALASAGSVISVGAAGAPGIGTVVGVMAADAAAVLMAANRAVAHVAAYYGYDVERPEERLFAAGVLGMGTAGEAGKAAAYIELNKLVQALARNATWQQLRRNTATKVVDRVFALLGYRITKRKLGQAIPVLGSVIGAGMNATMMTSVIDTAEHIYRERFLRERYRLDVDDVLPVGIDATGGPGDVVDIVAVLDQETAAEVDAALAIEVIDGEVLRDEAVDAETADHPDELEDEREGRAS